MKKHVLYFLLQFAAMFCFGQTYHLGDLYTAEDGSQGIVFFVTADGGGWAVALHDASGLLPWATTGGDIPTLPNYGGSHQMASADTSGYTNTLAIRNYMGAENNYAAGVVDFDHGWYLPAAAQLSLIYAQLPFIQASLTAAGGTPIYTTFSLNISFSDICYWTSTESNSGYVWVLPFIEDVAGAVSWASSTGTPTQWPKTQEARVRAICSFPPPENVYDTTLTYSWNTGSTEPHFSDVPLQTTNYTVTVTNAYGCTNSTSVTVTVIDNEPQTIYDTVCQGSAYDNYGFSLTAAETNSILDTTLTRTISANGCESEITLFLTFLSPDIVEIEEHAGQSFVWNGIAYTEEGTYTQYFNNIHGCDSTVILTLTFDGSVDPSFEPDTIPFGEADSLVIYLPNAITPTRNDGLNDYFCLPDAYKPLISSFEISIFNRWGTRVYHATDKNFRWDGRINGKIFFNNVYNYRIDCLDIIGRPYILRGTITVL